MKVRMIAGARHQRAVGARRRARTATPSVARAEPRPVAVSRTAPFDRKRAVARAIIAVSIALVPVLGVLLIVGNG